MSAQAMGWVYEHSPYKGSDLLIHLALADSANDMHGYELWASQNWIAKKARVARQTVNTFLARAIEEGMLVLLQDNSKARQPNRYRLLMPDSAPQMWSPKHGWDAPKDDVGHVAVDDMSHSAHVSVDDMHMSPETTSHVLRGDTNPIEPKDEPNPPMTASPSAAPSSPRGSKDSGLDQSSTTSEGNENARTGSAGEGEVQTAAGSARAKYDTSGHAYDLCLLLQQKVRAEHNYTPKIKNSNAAGWVATMDRLITRGPNGREEREPVSPEKVRMMINYVYTYGAEGDNFRWADQVRSPQDLTRHWEKLRTWANHEHQRRAKAKAEPTGAINQAWMVRSNKS